MNITVGADPELFVVREEDGVVVPAHDMIPGTKEYPYKVKGGAVQVDGVAVEYNIDPCSSEAQFLHQNRVVLNQLACMLPRGHKLSYKVDHTFPKDIWDAVPEEAKELGCDPDMNAYEGKINVVPEPPEGYRTAAGHIHVGWTEGMDPTDEGHIEACVALAKQLDRAIGFPSLLFEPENNRRSLYGRAGDFRPKSYGMEWRTPSNFWVGNAFLTQWVFQEVVNTFHKLMDTGGRFDVNMPDYVVSVLINDMKAHQDIDGKRKLLTRSDSRDLSFYTRRLDDLIREVGDNYVRE